jgi:hypothetical protein
MCVDEAGELRIDVRELAGQEPYARGGGLQCQRGDSAVDRGGRGVARQGPDCLVQAADAGTGLVFACRRGPGCADRVEPVVRRAAGASEGPDFDDVLAGRASSPASPAAKLPVPSNAQTRCRCRVNLDPPVVDRKLTLQVGFWFIWSRPGTSG